MSWQSGEAPGENEDREGKPFVGAAGRLLTSLLESAGLDRRDIYITNIVKCRPPRNRDPEPLEVEACSHFLDEQIALLQPDVILLLGRHALARLLPTRGASRACTASASAATTGSSFRCTTPRRPCTTVALRDTLELTCGAFAATSPMPKRRGRDVPAAPPRRSCAAVAAAPGGAQMDLF